MKRSLFALAALAAAPAWATIICPDGTKPADHYNNDCHAAIRPLPPVVQGGSPVTTSADSKAAAAAASAARSRSASRSSATGGAATATGGSARQRQQQDQATTVGVEQNVGNSNDINVNLAIPGGGSAGGGSRTIIPAPIYHGPGVAPLPAGAMLQFFRPCGSLQMVVHRPVNGRETNTGKQASEFEHTWTDVVMDATDGNGTPTPFFKDVDGVLWGSEYYVVTQQVAVGIEGALSGQVFGSKGGIGAGANSGVALTVPVQRVIHSLCKLPVKEAAPPPPPPEPRVVYRTRWRDRPVAAPVATPCCVAPPVCCTAVR